MLLIAPHVLLVALFTLIDLLISNADKDTVRAVLLADVSDHLPVFFLVTTSPLKELYKNKSRNKK